MEINTYHKLVKNENSAYKYLSKKCRKNGHRFCPRCNQRKLYKLRETGDVVHVVSILSMISLEDGLIMDDLLAFNGYH